MTKKKILYVNVMVLSAVVLSTLSISLLAEPKLKVRIIQTNDAGDNLDVIDPETNKVVGVIEGIEVGHGVAVAKDGSCIYVSDEGKGTLDVVDAKTLKVAHEIHLSGHPNNIALTPDGKRLYVAIVHLPVAWM